MGNSSTAIRSIYRTETLDDILKWASKLNTDQSGDLQFASVQKEIIQSRFTNFEFDYLTTSTIVCDRDFLPKSTNVLCLNVDDRLATQYDKVAMYDDVSPVSYLNCGRAIKSDDIRSFDEWMDHPFYKLHCKYFDIAKSITVSFRNLEHINTFLAFEYIASANLASWNAFDHRSLEDASFPFALAWYYRKGFMDDASLERRFSLLQNLSAKQLLHIRKYINSPLRSFEQQANEIGVSENWLKESLYNIRDILGDKLDWQRNKCSQPHQKSLRILDRELRFFEMLGDPSAPLITSL